MPEFQCPHIKLLDPKSYAKGAPREAFRTLRQTQPVCWQRDPYSKNTDTGYWAITSQKHLDFISKNPKIFSSEIAGSYPMEPKDGGNPNADMDHSKNMLTMDPPKHLKYRRIVRNAFKPSVIDSYKKHFSEVAEEVVSRALSEGKCEFVGDIASELPLIAICEILGVPVEDRKKFFKWSNTMIGGEDSDYAGTPEESQSAMIELWSYADKIMEQEKDNTDKENNIVSTLLNANVEGEYLNQEDFRYFMLLMIVAGNETTRNQTSHMMRLLMENPDQYQKLVDDPELISDAVEESLRYNSPVISFKRTAVVDCEVGGQQIKKGDKVVLFYQSASSDEQYFKNPDKYDITRPKHEPVKERLRAFGIGEHFCLGSHLARQELNVTFAAIVKHIRKPVFDGEVQWLNSAFINGIKSMPIKFETA